MIMIPHRLGTLLEESFMTVSGLYNFTQQGGDVESTELLLDLVLYDDKNF